MNDDLYRQPQHTIIQKIKDVPRESAFRLYCESSGMTWNLQVRGVLNLTNRSEGRDFIVATAALSLEDMKALRDAINDHLRKVRDAR